MPTYSAGKPHWTSTDLSVATVDQQGHITPVGPGTANIKQVTAITVVADPVTPPSPVPTPDPIPGPPPVSGTNEPAGMSVLTSRTFASLNEQGWDDSGNGKITTDSATVGNFLRTTLPAGFKPGSGTASGDFTFPAKRTVYVRYNARYSDNWKGGEAGLDKQFYLYEKGGTPSAVGVASGQGTAKKLALMEGQEILAGGQGHGDAANPDWGPNQGANAEFVRGQWTKVEWVFVGNTAGIADGTIQGYINDALVISYSGIKFVSGACLWSWFHYTNIWTGSSGSVPAAQTLDFSDLYLSGK